MTIHCLASCTTCLLQSDLRPDSGAHPCDEVEHAWRLSPFMRLPERSSAFSNSQSSSADPSEQNLQVLPSPPSGNCTAGWMEPRPASRDLSHVARFVYCRVNLGGLQPTLKAEVIVKIPNLLRVIETFSLQGIDR